MYFIINFIALILFFFAEHSIRAIVPLFVTEYLFFDRTFSGYFIGVFSVGGVVAQLLAGALADKFGKLRVYGVSLLFISIIACFYGVASTILVLLFVRLMHGFCSGTVRTMYQPTTASLVNKEHLGKAIGIMGIAAMAGMMVGAPAAVKMTDAYSYPLFFKVAAFLYLCAALMVCLIRIKENVRVRTKFSLNSFIVTSAVPPFIALRFIHSMCHGIFLSYGIIFAREISMTNSGLFVTAFACGNMLFRPIIGFVTDRVKKWYVIMGLAYLVIIMGYVVFSTHFLVAGAFMIGIGSGIEYTSVNSAIFKRAEKHELNRISATMEIVVSLSLGAGASLSGLLYSGPLNRLFLFIAIAYIIQIFILYILYKKNYYHVNK